MSDVNKIIISSVIVITIECILFAIYSKYAREDKYSYYVICIT